MCATGRGWEGAGPVSSHNYVVCTTRWQSSLDWIRVEQNNHWRKKMVKREAVTNNIKTKYTNQICK